MKHNRVPDDNLEIKNDNPNGNEINIVANISYTVTSDSKAIHSTSTIPITLLDEFEVIKINSTNVKNSDTKTKNQTKSKITLIKIKMCHEPSKR